MISPPLPIYRLPQPECSHGVAHWHHSDSWPQSPHGASAGPLKSPTAPQLCRRAGRKHYVFVMGKLNEAKLANFLEVRTPLPMMSARLSPSLSPSLSP